MEDFNKRGMWGKVIKEHNNFDNEITGDYYKEAKTELPWLLVTVIVSAVTVLIVEWTGLADYLLSSVLV